MGEIANKSKFFIDFSGGNFQLRRVKKCGVTFDEKVDVVLAVGVEGGAGYRDTTGGGEITLDVFPETGDPEVDYWRLRGSKERFAFVIQDIDGQRQQYRGCRVVARPDRSIDAEGENMNSVKIKFLQAGLL